MKNVTWLMHTGVLALAPCAVLAAPLECLIEPAQIVEVRSPAEGLIEKINVQRGDRVKRGQVLVELESKAERSAVESARFRSSMEGRILSSRGRAEYASKKMARSHELFKQNYVAAQARDETEAEKRIAEAELQEALETQQHARIEYRRVQDLLDLRTLRAPFDGVVMDRLLNPGDLAESGTGRKPILKLAQIDPLRVEVAVPVEAYRKLKVGMPATVMPEVLGGRYPATVRIVDKVLDAASGTFGVRLDLPNRHGVLPAGLRCKVEFPQLGMAPPSVPRK